MARCGKKYGRGLVCRRGLGHIGNHAIRLTVRELALRTFTDGRGRSGKRQIAACCCGVPTTPKTIHRTDGPCYVARDNSR